MGKGLVIGIIVVVIVLIGGYFLFSGQGETTTQDTSTSDQDQVPPNTPPVTQEPSVNLLSYPSTAITDEEVTLSWSMGTPSNVQATHTAIHYSTVSQPGNFGFDVTPSDSGYAELTTEYASGNFQAGTFETILTLTETTYFRAHAIINGNNYWTDENMITVGETSGTTAAIKEFTMTAKKWEFTPSIITVNEGDTVKLTIESIDVNHGITLAAFGVSEILSPGNTVDIEFVANQKGTFSFFCSVPCGSGHSTMKGTLIVE